MSSGIELRAIDESYRRGREKVEVLKGLSLDIAAGDFLALMGPSGSGKTTLLNLISGLDRADQGEIQVNGRYINRLSGDELAEWRAAHIGFVFQFYNLMPMLTAARNIELPLLLHSMPAEERRDRVAAVLDLVGLSARAGHKPPQLSGGEQQRVAIARALAADPDILVCDEPTGDLDRGRADEILGLLQLLNQRGKTIVMVTHDVRAADHARHTVHMDKGVLASERTAA